jgi:demethoxyubiquinone hydroxylase (CLK1/Coq7/Cat5 family)
MTTEKMASRFNELLRNELSAVETYNLALKRTTHLELSNALRQLRDDHDQRVTGLRTKIREIGATPSEGSGAWGAWAKAVQVGADLLGDKTAIAALEEGEDHGLKLYTSTLRDESVIVSDYVKSVLLPAEQKSHALCRSLKSFVKAAS